MGGILIYALAALAEILAKGKESVEKGCDLIYFYANVLFIPIYDGFGGGSGGFRWLWWLWQFYPLAADVSLGRSKAWRIQIVAGVVGLLIHTISYIASVFAAEDTGNDNVVVYTHLYCWVEYVSDIKWILMAPMYGEPFSPETKALL